MAKLSVRKVKNALIKSGGMPTHAAKLLKVDYSSVWEFMKKHPELNEVRDSARSKLHEDLESLTTFAIRTGYIQKSVLDENGKPTSETVFEEVDARTRLQYAVEIMRQYKGSVGIKDQVDVTTDGKEIKPGKITVIELPEILRPKSNDEETPEN